MSVVDDEWESFLSQGAIILSNEKNSAKNNVTNSYQKNMDSTMTSYTAIIDTHNKTNTVLKTSSSTSLASSSISLEKSLSSLPVCGSGSSKTKHPKPRINVSCLKNIDTSESTESSESSIQSRKNNVKTKRRIPISDDEGDNLDDFVDLDELDVLDENATTNCEEQQPVCSNIYISTKTKISYLNEPIDIKKVFWNIPISSYSTPNECIIKKQIKVSTTDPKELEEIRELLKNEKYYQEQEIEHIDNPEGRIKFKVQLKINVGLCKKDILNYRCKLKRAFFNCFVLIMRIRDHTGEGFKEMHIKVFNT